MAMNLPKLPWAKLALAAALVVALVAGGVFAVHAVQSLSRTRVVAYFANSNGVFAGDDVRIRGVNVGTIESIEPQPMRAKVTFWVDDQYKVPADAKAVILSPTLVTARAIQLVPPYTSGPTLANNAVIPQERTAVPMEFDDLRAQLERLSKTLQPTEPGGVSALGAFVNTTADNLRGQGPAIRDAVIKLSQALSALGDHSGDTFSTLKNLASLVSALEGSTDLIRQLNGNLASVTGQFANDPAELSNAIKNLNDVVGQVKTFVADNRDTVGTTTDKLASVTKILEDSLPDLKQFLHVAPTTLGNLINIYQPAQGTLTSALAVNNFANPIQFLCGSIQAASRLNAEQSSKLCVQYLAPIVKNRQYNFLPFGINPFVGTSARPNEITYSEDWMRPDYVPQQPQSPAANVPSPGPAAPAQPIDPSSGLAGLMTAEVPR